MDNEEDSDTGLSFTFRSPTVMAVIKAAKSTFFNVGGELKLQETALLSKWSNFGHQS